MTTENVQIKKAFVDLVDFLEKNKSKNVSTIIEQVKEMCSSNKANSTVYKDDKGNVIAIYCYYHKQWELLSEVEYGVKANTASGYNTMCKIGVSKWTKAQRDAKKASQDLLNSIAKGTVEAKNVLKLQADIESKRKTMDKTEMPKGYKTIELALAK
jgi:hypothetical protein